MRKVPTIVLSITYKGVKFIDAANKVSDYTHARTHTYIHIFSLRKGLLLNQTCSLRRVIHQIEAGANDSMFPFLMCA